MSTWFIYHKAQVHVLFYYFFGHSGTAFPVQPESTEPAFTFWLLYFHSALFYLSPFINFFVRFVSALFLTSHPFYYKNPCTLLHKKQNTISYHSPVESRFARSRSLILLPITSQVRLWLSTELLKVTISLRLYLSTSARYFRSYLALHISASTATIQSRLGSLIFAFISLYFAFRLFSLYSLIFTIL